jgi:sialidase-1
MNPCPVVDGDQVLLFCMNAHKTDKGRHRHLLVRSADDGATWSAPEDITDAVGNDTFIPGPGVGIRMRTGRLVIPGCIAEYAADRTRLAHYSCVVFSDDGGRSWRKGAPVADPVSNEAQVVELRDGTLLLNWRINYGDALHPGCRGTAISRDGGETWDNPVPARALNDARCQAGWIYRPSRDAHDDGWLLFSNPDCRPLVGNARTRMTIRLSRDEGRTWPVARLIHAGPSAYSCPAVLPDDTLAVLYESGESDPYERLRLARFSRNWLEQ